MHRERERKRELQSQFLFSLISDAQERKKENLSYFIIINTVREGDEGNGRDVQGEKEGERGMIQRVTTAVAYECLSASNMCTDIHLDLIVFNNDYSSDERQNEREARRERQRRRRRRERREKKEKKTQLRERANVLLWHCPLFEITQFVCRV